MLQTKVVGTFKPGTPKWASRFKMGNGSVVDVLGTGTVTIMTRVNKILQALVLRDVYLVPDLRRRLRSISCLRNDYKILFNRGIAQITAYKGRCVASDT